MKDALIKQLKSWEAILLGLVVVAVVLAIVSVPGFADPFAFSTALAFFAPAAMMALPMALLIIVREIDISVASVAGLSSVAAGLVFQNNGSVFLAVIVALLTGLVCGAINGFFVALLRLPSLLVTLGTMALFRGLCYVFLGGTPISPVPDFFTAIGNDNIPGTIIPWAILPFVVLAIIFGVALQKGVVGRRMYAIGGNPDTARYSGIHNVRITFLIFLVSGVIAAMAGLINIGITSQVAPDAALGMELDAITIAFLGGISFLGGKGKITGVVLAAALIITLRKSLQLLNVSGYTQGIAIGGVLILSLLITNLSQSVVKAIKSRRRTAAVQSGATSAS